MSDRLRQSIARVRIERLHAHARVSRRRPMPQQTRPKLIEIEYSKAIIRLVDRIRQIYAPLIDALPVLLPRTDSVRLDAGNERMRGILNAAREKMRASMSTTELDILAKRFADRTTDWNAEQLNRQTRAALGVDVFTKQLDDKMRALVDNFATANAELVKALGEDVATRVSASVFNAVQAGTLHADLAKQLQKDFDFGEDRAKRIARNEIGGLYGRINAGRQKSIGVTKFIWRTVGDDRVRDEHEEFDGNEYEYSDPPDGIPGEPFNCRCHADPVLTDLLDALE